LKNARRIWWRRGEEEEEEETVGHLPVHLFLLLLLLFSTCIPSNSSASSFLSLELCFWAFQLPKGGPWGHREPPKKKKIGKVDCSCVCVCV
jgi:hypothetical protein